MKKTGIYILIISIVFNFVESLLFGMNTELGFNLKPMSIAEYFCDSISLIGQVIGVYMILEEFIRTNKKIREDILNRYTFLTEQYNDIEKTIDRIENSYEKLKDTNIETKKTISKFNETIDELKDSKVK